jgi:hypothetical protein
MATMAAWEHGPSEAARQMLSHFGHWPSVGQLADSCSMQLPEIEQIPLRLALEHGQGKGPVSGSIGRSGRVATLFEQGELQQQQKQKKGKEQKTEAKAIMTTARATHRATLCLCDSELRWVDRGTELTAESRKERTMASRPAWHPAIASCHCGRMSPSASGIPSTRQARVAGALAVKSALKPSALRHSNAPNPAVTRAPSGWWTCMQQ